MLKQEIKIIKRILKWFIISIVAIVGIFFLYSIYEINSYRPVTDGTVQLKGLSNTVTVIRDRWGVPHITAEKNSDAYHALGYVMAQDRLWQMDILRRAAAGRLSEIIPKNEKIRLSDKIFRTLCIRYYSEQTYQTLKKDKNNEDLLRLLNHFVTGINDFIRQNKGKLSVEFNVLGYEPEEFTVVDSLSMAGVLAVSFNPTLKSEVLIGRLVKKYGLKKALEVFPDYPPDAPHTLSSYVANNKAFDYDKTFIHGDFSPYFLLSSLGGSNGWVVSPKKSQSGKVVLVNDPHILLVNPSIWYEAHIKTDQQDFSGFFIPLIPFGLVGHNRNIAWGITMMLSDASDFYIEELKKEGSNYYYKYKGQWRKAKVIRQKLKIKGEKPIPIDVPITAHGPIVTSLYYTGSGKNISLRWSFYDKDNLAVKAFYKLNHANNWKEFKEALSYYKAPGINVLYGDVEGNIGYYGAGAIPIRAHPGDGLYPMDGVSGKYDWKRYVPFSLQPHSLNPKEGYIVTANNKVVGKDYPYYITRHWEPKDRAYRITELINQKEKLSIEDHQRIHMDTYSLTASELIPYLLKAYEQVKKLSGIEEKALKIMREWDFHQPVTSIPATIYNKWYFLLLQNVLKTKLGQEDFGVYCETRFSDKLMIDLFQRPRSWWFDDPKTKTKESRDDIIIKSFKLTLKKLTTKLGKDISQWTWGKVHQVTFMHPFGAIQSDNTLVKMGIKPLKLLVNVGPFPIGGNRQSVNKAKYLYDVPSKVLVGPSIRMIVDFAHLSRPLVVNTTGQSGHIGHKHYGDQTEMWLQGKYRVKWYDKKDIEDHKEGTLILSPPGD